MKPSAATRAFLTRWLFSPLQGITFRYWLKALWINRFRVSPRYWPRAFFTTLTSLKNSWVANRENKKFGTQIAKASVNRPIFIFGHYRSGTTHLHNLFAVDQRLSFPGYLQVTYPHTFLLEGPKMDRWGTLLSPEKRPYDDVRLSLKMPAEEELAICVETLLSTHMSWHFPENGKRYEKYLSFEEATLEEKEIWKRSLLHFAKKLSYQNSDRPIVFKSPCHTARIPMLLEIFPDARFVNIHRNPYQVFASTHHMEMKVRPLFAYQKCNLQTLDDFILRRYRKMHESYFAAVPKIPPQQFFEISYDQLDAHPLETMEKIYHHLHLPDFDEVRPKLEKYLFSLKGFQKNHHPKLSAEITAKIQQEWKLSFDHWNYPLVSWQD